MVQQTPLVLINGEIAQMPVGDTISPAIAPGGGGGAASITEVEVDFGTLAVKSKVFTITDALVSTTSKITVVQSGKAATGRSADENEMDHISLNATPQAGTFKVNAYCLTGRVNGKFKLNYLIG